MKTYKGKNGTEKEKWYQEKYEIICTENVDEEKEE